MLRFLNWLVRSSENPNNISLTVKGFLTSVIAVLLLVAPIFHLHTDQGQLQAIVDMIIQAILGLATVISAIAGIVGLIRKIGLSGTNPIELQTTPMQTQISDSPAPVVVVPPDETPPAPQTSQP